MSTKRKALRYGMKKQDQNSLNRKGGIATSMKLLRSVLAVGFAMTPFMGYKAALAAGNGIVRSDGITLPSGLEQKYLQSSSDKVANIYAEQASGSTGLNRFKYFDVGAGQIANLYFQTGANGATLDTLVNTVENQINISGTVNAIRNNKIGGNLYFLSPKGMVVGAGGAINAGSLTVIGTGKTFSGDDAAQKAAEAIADNKWDMDNDAVIEINGQINTMTGIDLRAAHIALKKDADNNGTPLLRTGAVFSSTVNTDGLYPVLADQRLTVVKDASGTISFKDGSGNAAELNGATGDGGVKLTAEATQRNMCFNTFTIKPTDPNASLEVKDTVEAKVDIGAGSTVSAAGDVNITATASRLNDNNPLEFWDIFTFTNAEINVDGSVNGQNVAVSAKATSSFTGSNNPSALYVVDNRTTQIINNNNEKIDVDINNSLTDAIMNKLLEKQIFKDKTKYLQTMNNIVQQLYMPFSFVDAKASVNQGVDSIIQSTGNLSVNAESSASNKLTAAIQHKVTTGSNPISMPVGGGFVYVQTDSNATVNLKGKAEAGGNLIVGAKATNTSVSSMALKKVRSIDTGEAATGGSGVDYWGLALAINMQDNNAVVNLGTSDLADKGSVSIPRVKAGGALNVNATTIDTVSSSAVVATTSDSIINTTINIVDSDGKAAINSYVPVQGASVSMGSTELLNNLSITTDGSSGVELTGLDYLISTATVKQGVENTVTPFLKAMEEFKRYAAGEQVNLETDAIPATGNKPAQAASWNSYFSVGVSLMVANVDNIAQLKLAPGASITSTTGDIKLASKVTVGDSLLVTKNLLTNEKKSSVVGVSAAIAVEDMHNTAEVTLEDSDSENATSITAAGSVVATAEADQSYNRLDKMVEALKKGLQAAEEHWTSTGIEGAQDAIQRIEAAVADLLTITAKDSAVDLSKSKQHTLKAKALVDLLAQVGGVSELKSAVEAFCNAANYTNMYVSSSTDKMDTPMAGDSTAMATGTVGIQNLDNNASVKLGSNTHITAGNDKLVQLDANVKEGSFLMAGKWAFLPDIYTTDAGAFGIGGTVGVQNVNSNSLVQVMNGVSIDAGAINMATHNDVLNIGLAMGGARTSTLGLTGMVNYMGGVSTAQTKVDDDVYLTAHQKQVELSYTDANENTITEAYKGVELTADNNTIVVGMAGDFSSTNANAIGVSTSVADYKVQSLAVVENQEATDTDGGGTIAASDVLVSAHTGGVINSLSVAGNTNDTRNTNEAAGGASASTSGGQGAQGVENIEGRANTNNTDNNNENNNDNDNNNSNTTEGTDNVVQATAEEGNTGNNAAAGQEPAQAQKNPVVQLKAAGSVSVNYIEDETRAGIDNVEVALQRPASGEDMTTNLSIQAQDDSYIGSYSGAGALSKQGVTDTAKFGASINGAVAFNEIVKTTSAGLKNTKVINADNVLNQSESSGAQVALGLALGVDLAKRMDGVQLNLGGSGSLNFVNSTVQAVMEGSELLGRSAGSLNVFNTAYDKDVQVAGGASVEYAGTGAVGASVAVNEVSNDILASLKGTSIGTADGYADVAAGTVRNLAVSKLVQVGGAMSAGIALGTSNTYVLGDVAVATNVVDNKVQATADGVTILASSFTNEARDGKLENDTTENKYITELNSVPNTAIQVDVAVYQDAAGLSVVRNLNGEYVYEATGAKVPEDMTVTPVEGTGTGKYYVLDENNTKQYIVQNEAGQFVYEGTATVVDINAPITQNMFDVDVDTALANANGSTGINIALKTDSSGNVDANQHYTSANVTVNDSGNVIIGSAIGLAIKAGGNESSVGAAVATNVNYIDNSFTSELTGSKITVSGAEGVKVHAESDSVLVGIAAGAAATVNEGTATVDVAGSAVANVINNDTIAKAENSEIATPKLDVDATTQSTLVSVAGQLSATISNMYGGAAGLTWAQNDFDNTTGAYVRGMKLTAYDITADDASTALNVNAYNNSDMYTIGVGVGGGLTNGALVGALAWNYGTNNTEALVEKYTGAPGPYTNTIIDASSVKVQAKDDSDIVTVAGSLGLTGSTSAAVTVGGAVATTAIGSGDAQQRVRAGINDTWITMASGGTSSTNSTGTTGAEPLADISVRALNDANVVNLALGGGIAASTSLVGVCAEGSVSVADVHSETLASMNNVDLAASSSDVEVLAQSDNDIVSSADAVNITFGSVAGVTGGAAVSVLNSDMDTKVEVKNTSTEEWNVSNALLQSDSNSSIFNLAMGLGVGASGTAGVSAEGNVAVNNINNDTSTHVEGACITAAKNLGVLANSIEHLQNYGGAVSVGAAGTAGVGVGATVVVNTISGNTVAEVNNSDLYAQGDNEGINIKNYTVDNYGLVTATSAVASGIVVNAESKHKIDNVTVSSSIGGAGVAAVGVGVTADVNEISGETKAAMSNSNINKGQNSVGDVHVLAHDAADISADVVNIDIGGSGVASVAALGTAATNIISRDTSAVIDGDTSSSATSQKVLNANNARVYALGERKLRESVTGVGIAASAEGAATAAANVSVVELTDNSLAAVRNMTGSVHSLTVDDERAANVHSYNNVITLTGAIGTISAGCGVTVLDDQSGTQAQLVNSSFTRRGNKDTTSKVNVLANNNTYMDTELTVPQLAVSIGGVVGVAVECVNMEALVGVTMDEVSLGESDSGYTQLDAVANNKLTNMFTNANASASAIGGAMVGVGSVNINSKTFTDLNAVTAYADDINVRANEARTANAALVAANVAGGITVGVNLMYTNIGDSLQDSYTYYRGDNAETGAEQTGTDTTTSVQAMVNNALAGNKAVVDSLEEEAGTDLEYTASSSMNKGDTTNKGLSTSVTGNSKLQASNVLTIEAAATNNVYNTLEQVQVSLGAIAVASNRINVVEHQSLTLYGANLLANTININSHNTSALGGSIGTVPLSGTGYTDTTGYIKYGGSNTLTVLGSQLDANKTMTEGSTEIPLAISASNSATIDNLGHNVTVTGAGGGRLILEGEDASTAAVNLGNTTTNNSLKAAKIAVQAQNNPHVKNEATIVDTGVLVGSGTIITSKVSGGASLGITDKNTFDAGEVALLALSGSASGDNKYTTEATAHNVSVTMGDITVNKVRTYNEMNTGITLGAAQFLNGAAFSDLSLSARNLTDSYAYIHTTNVPSAAGSGNNFAYTNAHDQVHISVDGGTAGIVANNLSILAENTADVTARAIGTEAGTVIISPYTARVGHSSNSVTDVNLDGNLEAKGAFTVNAQSNDTVNLKADALTVTLDGGGDAHVDSSITSSTSINVKSDSEKAVLKSGNDMLLQANNNITMNRAEGFSEMLWGQGYGATAIDTAGINNTLASTAKVLLKNVDLISTHGAISLSGYTNEDLLVNGYVFSVGLIGGSVTNVNNTITNKEAVELENSSITTKSPGKAITLSAADDLKLCTYALTETPIGAIGGSNADLTDRITRTNTIALKNSGNSLYSTQDINLYAGKKLNGNVAMFDLDAEAKNFNGDIIPVVLMPTVKNIVAQSNTVTINANSSSNSVRHTNIYADAGQELTRVLAARDTGYGGSSSGGYVTEASGDEKYEKTSTNKVDINGSVTAGSGNVIRIQIGDDNGNIAIFNADDRAVLTGITALDEAGLRDKITIEADPITGVTAENITLSRASYTLFLLKRYNEVMALLEEYSKDGATLASDGSNAAANAAYLGYQAEAERLRSELLNNGGMYMDDAGVYRIVDARYIDYVEIPSLIASGGNITIQTDTVSSSSGDGKLTANGSADIDIINNTNLLLKLNTITVDSDGGKLIYNGQVLKPENYTTEGINAQLTQLNEKGTPANFAEIDAKAGEGSSINIEGNYSGAPLNYQYNDEKGSGTGIYTPMADIWVQDNILNQTGAVSITSLHNNIRIAGAAASDAVAISGKTVALSAGGSITQSYTDGVVSVGGSVESIYGREFGNMQDNHYGQTGIEIKETAPTDGQKATGSYIAGGSIYINARDININGVVQSGYSDYYLDMTHTTAGEGAAVEEKIAAIIQNYTAGTVLTDEAVKSNNAYKVVDGGAYWDMYEHCYKYKLNAYYNPYTGKIIVEDVDASGGKIYLTGRIVSTGRGKLICLDGVSNIDIKNGTIYGLQVGNLLTHDVEGVISITDTAAYSVKQNGVDTPVILETTIKKNSTDVKYLAANGQYITPDSGSAIVRVTADSTVDHDYIYNPKSGLRYTWTEGEQKTTYVRYEKDVMDGGWGLWSLEEEQKTLKEWSTSENKIATGSTNGDPRLKDLNSYVIEDAGDTSKTHMDYSSKTLDTSVYSVESDTVYHSGVFGCHEHHDVVWTESTGTLETYHASVKADQPIAIKFIGYNPDAATASDENAKIAAISIDSGRGVDITGTIGNTQVYKDETTGAVTEKGIIKINSLGAIEQKSGSLYGAGIELLATQGIKGINIVAGDNVALALLNLGANYAYDADVTVNSAVGAKGNLALATVDSGGTGGNAWKNLDITNNSYQGDIWNTSSNTVSASRINLTTINGSIYGAEGRGSAFAVNVGQAPLTGEDSLSASLNANAYGDINIKQANGYLRLGRVYSKTGDVALEATNGSIVDALPTDTSNKGTAEERIARWKSLGMIGGEGSNTALLDIKNRLIQYANANKDVNLAAYEQYDVNALLYTVAESIVNPDGSSLAKTSSKDPNVIGHNITLTAGKSVGYDSGTAQNIQLNGILKKNASTSEYENPNALSQLQALSNASLINVSVSTDASGNTIAALQDKQAVGVQQITSLANAANGKLTVTASGSDDKGYILLEGREEVGNDSFIGIDNKGKFNNLYVNSISSAKGEVNLTSLGSIYNNADNVAGDAVNIKGRSLYITAVDELGTSTKMLTTDIFGTDKAQDGLSAVAGGNIYLNQISNNNLILRNISSGKTASDASEGGADVTTNKREIYLGAKKDILMGTNGTAEDYFLRADGLELTIESREGSIGEAVYELDENEQPKLDENNQPIVLHTANAGVRIKNVDAADAASKVVLKAAQDIYVNGLSNATSGSAPSGVLNLQVADVTEGVSPAKVGIVVDGSLNLLEALQSSNSASVYTTTDLLLNNQLKSISSKNIYLGSKGTVTVNGTQQIHGTDSITVDAGQDVLLHVGHLKSAAINLQAANGRIEESRGFILDTAALTANAKGDILLDSHVNQLQQVNVATTNGSIAVGNGNITDAALSIAINNNASNPVVGGDLTVHNYSNKNGKANNIVLANVLTADGDITIINEEADVAVGANGAITAKNIILQADNNAVLVNGGSINATSTETDAGKLTLKGNSVQISGGSITANTASINADTSISINGGSISAGSTSMTAGTGISLTSGSVAADAVALTASNGAILESEGFVLNTAALSASAHGAISLASKNNQLSAVQLENADGDIVVYNDNVNAGILNIAILNEDSKINGSLLVHNFNEKNGAANTIVLNKQLTAKDSISLINDEAYIDVAADAALTAQNITLQANNNAVIVSGGTITAVSDNDNAAAGVVTLNGNSVQLNSGAINAKIINLTSGTTITEAEGFILVTPVLNTSANGVTDLKSTTNQLERVQIKHAGGSVTIASTNRQNENALAVNTANNTEIQGDFSVINYADSSSNNDIVVSNSLQATGNITITNQEAAIAVNNAVLINANDIVLKAATDMNVNGNVTAAHDASLTAGTGLNIAGELTSANATTLNASAITVNGSVATTDGTTALTSAGALTLSGSGTVSGKTVNASAGQDFIHEGSTISADTIAITATNDVLLKSGSLNALDANASSSIIANNGAITEYADYAVQIPQLNVSAKGGIGLSSEANTLQNVVIGAAGGDVTLVSGNAAAGALKVQLAQTSTSPNTINGDLSITNIAKGSTLNKIIVDGVLRASGAIELINNETDVEIAGTVVATNAKIDAAGGIALNSGSMEAQSANLQAAYAIAEAAGFALQATNLYAHAGNSITLDSQSNQLGNVFVGNDTGDVSIGNGGDANLNIALLNDEAKIAGDLRVTNYDSGIENAVHFNRRLEAAGDITIINQETGIQFISEQAHLKAQNISLQASNDKIDLQAGLLEATEAVLLSGKDIAIAGGAVNARSASLTASNGISLTSGGITAAEATLNAGSINENDGFALETPKLNITSAGAVNLNSKLNQLEQVKLVDVGGSITIGSGNKKNSNALDIAMASVLPGDLTVINYNDSSGNNNLIVVPNTLQANGDITLINEEADITIGQVGEQAQSASMHANEITLQAMNHDIIVANATLTAANVSLTGDAITLANGSILADETILTAAKEAIIERDGFILNTDSLDATAVGEISLASKLNQLAAVGLANSLGDITVYNANVEGQDLNIAVLNENATIKGNLLVHNFDEVNGAANKIVINKKLVATGDISLINEEAAIDVANGARLDARNITLTAGNETQKYDVSVSDGVLVAGTVTVDKAKDILLHTGSIVADKVTFVAAENIDETAGFALETPELEASAPASITLASRANQLEQVDIKHAGGSVTIGSANSKNANALWISIANKVTGDLQVTNYSDSSGNNNVIEVPAQLQATGSISMINEEAAIVVAQNAVIDAGRDVVLNAAKELQVNGSVSADNDISLQAKGIVVNGSVSAINKAEINSSSDLSLSGNGTISGALVNATVTQDFIHTSGTISADDAVFNVGRNLLLQGGKLLADNATLSAGGYIAESYDNASDAFNGYNLQIANGLTVQAGAADANGSGINLGSKFNELQSVTLKATKGDIFIGSGRSAAGDLSITMATNEEVDGNISFHNYANGNPNQIYLQGSLQATKNIEIINDEAGGIQVGNVLPTISLAAGESITLQAAAGDILNTGAMQAKTIAVSAENGSVYNTQSGDMQATDGGITINAANVLGNAGSMSATNGSISLTSTNGELYNEGSMSATSGDIILHSVTGNVYNAQNARMLSRQGSITLWSEQGNVDNLNGADLLSVGGNVTLHAGQGNVNNAGDLMALGGNILLQSDNGNVTNTDNFNSLANNGQAEGRFEDKDVTTGSIIMSAANGKLFNNVDLEAGKDVTLIAKEGLASFGYNIYAGENISLTATDGNLVNTSTLESVRGDITLTAEHGNVYNGTSESERAGDIITLGGTVTLKAGLTAAEAEAKGQAVDERAYDVTNYGDIIAVNKNKSDDSNAGSIVLQSAYGSVYNFDDFNTYSKNADTASNHLLTLKKENHRSAGLMGDIENCNLATSNIILSAVNGEILNSKQYLVALGKVTMEAKEGIANAGQIILAGKDISLTDTDGDIFNRAQLISMSGDISLTAANGSVINMMDGDIYALNGDVNLHAKGAASESVQYVIINGNAVEAKALTDLVPGASVPQGAIVVTQRGYVNANGEFVELPSGEQAPNGSAIQTRIGYLDANNGYAFSLLGAVAGEAEAFRAGDVVNRGDLVALKGTDANGTALAGTINLRSEHGNIANYDEFAVLDNGAQQINYRTTTGFDGVAGNIRFNPGTSFDAEASFVLSQADLTMNAPEGYLYNTMNLSSGGNLELVSGQDLLLGVNVSDTITAVGDVKLESTQGRVTMDGGSVSSTSGSIDISAAQGVDISNGGSVTAEEGSVAISGDQGVNISDGAQVTAGAGITIGSDNGTIEIVGDSNIKSKDDLLLAAETGVNVEDANLQSLNGSLSAVAMYGDVNIRELAAAEMVAVGSGSGSITIGTIEGKEVVLYTENSNAAIKVETIKAQDSLVLQGDKISVANEVRSTDNGQLLVDITGAEGGTMEGELELDLAGDVRFTNLDVSYATINVDGPVAFERLHTSGELHIVSQDMVTSIYGKIPVHDDSNYVYYSLNEESASSGEHEVIHARDFALDKAQKSMETIHDRLANASGTGASDIAPDGAGWMYLYIDSPTYQRSNGLLLHIDTGYRAANQRWSAEDLSTKLADFQSHDSFVAHYGDAAGIFSRYDLLELAPRSVSQIVQDVRYQQAVLQRSNGLLRIAENKGEQSEKREREERRVANE